MQKQQLLWAIVINLAIFAAIVTIVIVMGWLGPSFSTRSGQRVVFVTWALFFLGLWIMGLFELLPRTGIVLIPLFSLSVIFLFLAFSGEFLDWSINKSGNQNLWWQFSLIVMGNVGILVLGLAVFFKPPRLSTMLWIVYILCFTLVYFSVKLVVTWMCWQGFGAHLQLNSSNSSSAGVLERAVENGETSLVEAQFEIDLGNTKGGTRTLDGKTLSRRLDAKLNELFNLNNTIRYAFLETTPTSESITLEAFRAVWADELREHRKEGDTKAKPVQLVKLPIEDEARMVKSLREQKELFQEVNRYVNESYLGLHRCLIGIDIVLGKSFGIHIAMYLLFVYCVWFLFPNQEFCNDVKSIPQNMARINQEIKSRISDGVVENIQFCRDSLPQLGFIGTLLGLSMAILELGEEDIVQIILQRPGISPSLAASLGLAFSTTLIALLLVILMGQRFTRLSTYHLYYLGLMDYLGKRN